MPRSRLRFGQRAGFSLLEVMIAMALVLLAVLGLSGMMALSGKMSRQSEARQIAMWIARQRIELYRATATASRPEITNKPFTIPASVVAQFPGAGEYAFQGTITIKNSASNTRLQLVSVRVSWQALDRNSSGRKKASSVEVSQMVATMYTSSGSSSSEDWKTYFVPPPPPPPPPTPVVIPSGGGSGGGGTPPVVVPPKVDPPADPPAPPSDPEPDGGGGGGETPPDDSTGGSSGGSSGGGSGPPAEEPGKSGKAEINFGGMWM